MKIYSKKDLICKNGYLVADDGEVVNPGIIVIAQMNDLEGRIQKRKWEDSQPKEAVVCTGKFKRKSEFDVEPFTADTPIMDNAVNESLALMDEIDTMETVEKMNKMQDEFRELVMFAKSDDVVSSNGSITRFDCPTIGNPLELTEAKLMMLIAEANGVEVSINGGDADV